MAHQLPDSAVWLTPLGAALADAGRRTNTSTAGELTFDSGDATVHIGLVDSPDESLRLIRLDARFHVATTEPDPSDRDAALRRVQLRIPVGAILIDDNGVAVLRWTVPAPADRPLGERELIEAIRLFDDIQQRYGDYIERICTDETDLLTIDAVMDHFGD